MLIRITALIAFIIACSFVNGQTVPAEQEDGLSMDQLASLPGKYYDKLSEKLNGIDKQLDKKTESYLLKIKKQELKLYHKLWQKDSAKAKELFGNVNEKYSNLQNAAAEKTKQLSNFSKVYSCKLDSLGTAFHFLENNQLVSPELQSKLKDGLSGINRLQDKLTQTDQIRKFLKERKKLLSEQLEKFGFVKELKQFNKQVYYYTQQIKEYKELLDNPSKLEEKLLGLLVKIPAFRNFFANNSQLGSLFNLPGSTNNNAASYAGLQTRASVMQDLQNRFGSGPAVQQMIQQNMNAAQGQLNELKNKVNQYMPGGGSSDDELPDFKLNNQKTKSFWQRIELGTNFQNQRSRGMLPVTSDIGLSVGYKLNDKSIIGIGASYKMGWGQSLRNISITNQGAGLRSYIDWKIKVSFWMSGGYEMNYRSEFDNIDVLKDYNAWQTSGLIGISKVVSMNSKLFKKTKVQLLWDFMSYQQMPRTQPIIFRVGYNLK
jgi:hypothetical protein